MLGPSQGPPVLCEPEKGVQGRGTPPPRAQGRAGSRVLGSTPMSRGPHFLSAGVPGSTEHFLSSPAVLAGHSWPHCCVCSLTSLVSGSLCVFR